MVVRPASFAPYWAEPATFGPMTRAAAERMVESRWGGHILTTAQFREVGYR